MIENGENKILIGAIPRSGKTYIMAGTILKHVKEHSKKSENINKFNKYIIITPSPSETLEQYEKAFSDYIDFDNYNIKVNNIKENNENLNFDSNKNHTVFLISKQRLGYKKMKDTDNLKNKEENMKKIEENVKKYFGNNTFNIIFMDEAHFGMSTEESQKIIKLLDKNNVPKIFVTATYNKPNIAYGIEEHQKISWNLDDIKHIKKFDIDNFEEDIKHFYKKFSKKIVMNVLKNNGWNKKINNKDVIKNIMSSYKTFPEPYLITSAWDKDFLDNEKQKIDNTDFSFDMVKLFTPKNTETFKNTEQLEQLFYYYFGYPDKNISYAKQNFYKKRGILPRIQNICNNNCRTLQNYSHKTSQLWFLPYGTGRIIAEVTNCLLHFLNTKFKYIFNKHLFFVTIENDEKKLSNRFKPANVEYMKKPENIKKEIESMEKELNKDNKYEGLIILAGGRLHLGISLPNVDIVTMFSGISSSDSIYQMLFRSMTELDEDIYCDGKSFCSQKKYGFMVDLNPQRTIYTLEYMTGELIDKNNKDSDKNKAYNIISDLINIDKDVFVSNYDDSSDNKAFVKELFERLYKSWDAKIDSINYIVKQIEFDKAFIKLFDDDIDIKTFFKLSKNNSKKNIVQEPENKIVGPKIKLNEFFNIKPNNKINEKESIIYILRNILAEVINILTIITSYNNFECLFNEKINIDDIDFKYEITKLLDDVNDEPLLKNIFINILKNRIINNEKINENNIDDEKIFNIITNIINGLIYKQKVGGNIIEINNTIYQRKKKIYTIHEPDKLLLFIHDNLKPKDFEKRKRGEVFTPMKLVNEMLDTLPEDVWTNPDLKWLDPAAGMGNFPIAIYMRLMECLKILIPDEEMRRKHILEKMLYMVELDESNVFMMKKILCGNKYKLNIFQGSFIEGEYSDDIDIFSYKIKMENNHNFINKIKLFDNNFNIIVGNPPYNKNKTPIWNIFINNSFKILNKKGYLLFVIPSGWRNISGMFKTVNDNIYDRNLLFLKIHNEKDGLITFGCETRFDIILVENIFVEKTITKIYYQSKTEHDIINIKNLIHRFIPNRNIKFIQTLFATKKDERVNLLYDPCSYHTQKDWIEKKGVKDNIFKNECVYTIQSNCLPTFRYSKLKYIKDIKKHENKCINKDIEHFGKSKLIWSNGRISSVGCYIDKKGSFGLTQFAYAILENDYDILEQLKKVFMSKMFKDIMEDCAVMEQSINYKIIALFKKDFYKKFINYKNINNSLPVVNIEIPKRNIKSIG
jgi:hypothetical protein